MSLEFKIVLLAARGDHPRELRGAGGAGATVAPVPPGRRLALRLPPRQEGGLGEPLRPHGEGHMADQGEVWAQLVCKADELDVDTPTGAMRDVYARHEIDMAPARQALAAQPGQVGALVYMGSQWVGLDLLAGPRLFGRAWPRLCAGYVADAIGRNAQGLASAGRLAALASTHTEAAPASG